MKEQPTSIARKGHHALLTHEHRLLRKSDLFFTKEARRGVEFVPVPHAFPVAVGSGSSFCTCAILLAVVFRYIVEESRYIRTVPYRRHPSKTISYGAHGDGL